MIPTILATYDSLIDPLHSSVNFTHATTLTPNSISDPASSPAPLHAKGDISDDTLSTPRPSTAVISVPTLPFLTNRSGGPLKSSLRVKGTHSWASLTVITEPAKSSSSKSAPATPTNKGVHFHSQLEHVKLFLTEQKPLAVSRDGDPTDTSGTDSEPPPFIYAGDDDLKERPLFMHCIDFPTAPSLAQDTRDVVVENIELVGTTVEGVVRVRNLSFEKWVAIRFTFDRWQTTSEVKARYKESVSNSTFDRFLFAIKLPDALFHAEEKTLYIAIRYSVAGREIWDNNSGRNYQVRVMHEKTSNDSRGAVVESRAQVDDIADLQRKLEEVIKFGGPSETIGGILAEESRRRWELQYDVAGSSRTPRCPPATHQTPSHARTNTHPSTQPNSVPWPHSQALRATCDCSPPNIDEVFPSRDPNDTSDLDKTVPSLRRRCSSGSGSRNHTRRRTIELSHVPGGKHTSSISQFDSPALLPLLLSAPTSAHPKTQHTACVNSFPPHSSPKRQLQTQESSGEGTPPITSSSSSGTPRSSPTMSPAEPGSPSRLLPQELDTNGKSNSPISYLDYHRIVSRCCFYTGPGPSGVLEHPDFITPSLPGSDIKEFFSNPYSSDSSFATSLTHGRAHGTSSDD